MFRIKERSWVQVSSAALAHNVGVFHKAAGSAALMAVVKSNAYGHGLVETSRLLASKIDWFGVDDLDEALALRAAGIKRPVLVLGYTVPTRFAEAARANVSVTVSSIESLKHCLKTRLNDTVGQVENCKLKIHLKLETGLNRQGITETELDETLSMLVFCKTLRWLEIEGVYSHFAAAELAQVPKYKKYCEMQMENFERMYAVVEGAVGKSLIKHMAGTAATLLLPQAGYQLVRVGIGMWGLDPRSISPKAQSPKPKQISIAQKLKLKPALSWHAIIAQVKSVKKGERVGYDLTKQVKRDTKIAIVPVGYWHGYPRSLSNKGEVLVKGKRCKVLGRVSMDMMTIDVTDVKNVKAGDEVILIGKGLNAEEVAATTGTINYELVTRINPGVRRFYV